MARSRSRARNVPTSNDHGTPPGQLTESQAAEHEAAWELYLRGYLADDAKARRLFDQAAGLNRRQRRQLSSKARKLRNRDAA